MDLTDSARILSIPCAIVTASNATEMFVQNKYIKTLSKVAQYVLMNVFIFDIIFRTSFASLITLIATHHNARFNIIAS